MKHSKLSAQIMPIIPDSMLKPISPLLFVWDSAKHLRSLSFFYNQFLCKILTSLPPTNTNPRWCVGEQGQCIEMSVSLNEEERVKKRRRRQHQRRQCVGAWRLYRWRSRHEAILPEGYEVPAEMQLPPKSMRRMKFQTWEQPMTRFRRKRRA